MKLENTLENKERFIALYWRQEVLLDENNAGRAVLYPVDRSNMYHIDKDILLLTPLSQISDEDAIEWYLSTRPIHYYDLRTEGYAHTIETEEDERWICTRYKGLLSSKRRISHDDPSFAEAMYLISKGYYVGDGTEIEYGWVKLKEV